MDKQRAIDSLAGFLSRNDSVVVLSGAGVSTASGIPDYRDHNGEWKQAQPMQFGEFRSSSAARKRYWARGYVGWRKFSRARPNAAHQALADLESAGKVEALVTQNVDGLHRQAGSRTVVDLHGNLSRIRCMDCDKTHDRERFQRALKEANPHWYPEVLHHRPDGDAILSEDDYEDFSIPGCPDCGGTVKPDVVMFGESVPESRVQRVVSAIDGAAALLVVGSSLMVYSGFRFARYASARKMPLAVVNLGRTRADEMATLRVNQDCGTALSAALELL